MDRDHLTAEQLLKCFFSECERQFRFLEQRYGYNFFCGLSEYQKNYKIIRPYNGQQEIGESFLATIRYEKDHTAIEIIYSSDQFFIEGYMFYSPADRFEFSEILTAARKSNGNIAGDWGITDNFIITKTLQTMSACFEKNSHILLDPSVKLMDRALRIRHTRLEQAIRTQHSENIKEICAQAALAFREKNYRLVVKLLEPCRDYLKKADLKKLDRARQNLLS